MQRKILTLLCPELALNELALALGQPASVEVQSGVTYVQGASATGKGGHLIVHAEDLQGLRQVLAKCEGETRLLAFCTGIIVPPDVLSGLIYGAYNLHPGPPEIPGLFPSVHALYEGDSRFGSTLHVMAEQVDCGPVVAVERFDIPGVGEGKANRWSLDNASLASSLRLIEKMAADIWDFSSFMPLAEGEAWSGPYRSKAAFEALCVLPSDVTLTEFQRRYNAVGEGPEHALSIHLFGHRFVLDNQREKTAITLGGKSPI